MLQYCGVEQVFMFFALKFQYVYENAFNVMQHSQYED